MYHWAHTLLLLKLLKVADIKTIYLYILQQYLLYNQNTINSLYSNISNFPQHVIKRCSFYIKKSNLTMNYISILWLFTSSFQNYIPFISFSYIVAFSRTSSMTLKRSVSGNILAFFLILEGKFLGLHH